MNEWKLSKGLTYGIAGVWFVNGLFCKILNLAPRHQEIVGRILGNEHAKLLTSFIGISEIGMALWIISSYRTKLNTITQILIILTMNILEFILVPDLLLWGKLNLLFASLFLVLIYFNETYLIKEPIKL